MTRRLLVALMGLAVVAAACGGGDAGVAVDDPWARNSPMMATAGAVYMDLTADVDDALVGASVDDAVAAVVEIHETTEMAGDMTDDADDGDDMGDDAGGMMQMSPVESIVLPAGETVNLEPGGYHVMLLDLAAPLEVGDTFELTLEFESGETETVEVEVRES